MCMVVSQGMLADQLKSKKVGVDSKRLAAAEGDPFLTTIDSLRLNARRHSIPVAAGASEMIVIGSSSPSSYGCAPS